MTEQERIQVAQDRVSVGNRAGMWIIRLDDVEVFSGSPSWARHYQARLVAALAANLHDFEAVAVATTSMFDDGDGPDPHPGYVYPTEPDKRKWPGPVFDVVGVKWDPGFKMFEFLTECPCCCDDDHSSCPGPDCAESGEECYRCGGEGYLPVMGCGREP